MYSSTILSAEKQSREVLKQGWIESLEGQSFEFKIQEFMSLVQKTFYDDFDCIRGLANESGVLAAVKPDDARVWNRLLSDLESIEENMVKASQVLMDKVDEAASERRHQQSMEKCYNPEYENWVDQRIEGSEMEHEIEKLSADYNPDEDLDDGSENPKEVVSRDAHAPNKDDLRSIGGHNVH